MGQETNVLRYLFWESIAKFPKGQHMKHVALLASAVTFIASTAFAADLPSRKVAPVAPVAPTFTWTGFYAGVNAGVSWWNRTANPTLSWVGSDPIYTPNLLTVAQPNPASNAATGFIGGLQLGYNVQMSAVVVGVEIDFMGAVLSNTGTSYKNYDSPLYPGNTTTNTTSTTIEQNWLSTVRLRAGYTMDRVLIYATGGLAFGDVKITNNSSNDTPSMSYIGYWQGSNSQVKLGYAVGAGLEYALTENWILRGEYLYYNLGSMNSPGNPTTQVLSGVVSANGWTSLVGSSKTQIDGNIVRAAVSYKF